MLTNYQVQAALVGYYLGQSSVTTLLCTGTEVREDQWQGNVFCYPNVRIKLTSLKIDPSCAFYRLEYSILVFSENPSSQQADTIAGAAAAVTDKKTFTTNGIHFASLHITDAIPAVREGQVWVSETTVEGIIHAG